MWKSQKLDIIFLGKPWVFHIYVGLPEGKVGPRLGKRELKPLRNPGTLAKCTLGASVALTVLTQLIRFVQNRASDNQVVEILFTLHIAAAPLGCLTLGQN